MSLVAFKARNHPQQATRDEVDDRRTDPSFFAEQHAKYGFTIDAAASAENAMLPRFWTIAEDALAQSWRSERVWCNPPYSQPTLERFVEKAWIEMVENGCASVAMLLPANRCEQPWWQKHVEPYRDGEPFHGVSLRSQFLPGRMRFGWPETKTFDKRGDRPPFGCVLLTWSR